MKRTVLKGVWLEGRAADLLIEDESIAALLPAGSIAPAETEVIDCSGLAAFPGLCNMHSHAPMVLLRGLGDDQPLSNWLQDYIWPAEQRLNDDLVYRGTLSACREMLRRGITFFNDMYFRLPAMACAVRESGLRARLGLNIFGDATELDDPATLQLLQSGDAQVEYSIAPHAIYTVSAIGLRRSAEACQRLGLKMHIHMSETEREVADCLRTHGLRPWEYLHQLGVLDMVGSNLIAAHCLHLSEKEIALMGKYGVTAVHCPNSNLKLGSGYRFPMQELQAAGVRVALGTDGAASSNNLCLLEAAKTAALLQKGFRQDPTVCTAEEVLRIATCSHRLNAGQRADLFLVPMPDHSPIHNPSPLSNLIYHLHSESVVRTIVGGKTLYCNA